MSRPQHRERKHYASQLAKSLKGVIAHTLKTQFPKAIGGPKLVDLSARIILDAVEANLRPREHIRHGQVLWLAVHKDHPPRRHQRIADTQMVPVLLDLSTPQDVHNRIGHMPAAERLCARVARLCTQAYEQDGLLSDCDLAEMLATSDRLIASALVAHEKATGRIVPRRANLHDVGSGVTHKGIICRKRYLQGKSPEIVARETYHSQEAVDHYLGCYNRVRCCRAKAMSVADTALALDITQRLVLEYIAIDDQLNQKPKAVSAAAAKARPPKAPRASGGRP